MANWVSYPNTLTGQIVDLVSLEPLHFPILELLARDKRIWEFYPFDGSNAETFQKIISLAITERDNGNQFPFVIIHKQENKIIGSTRFMDIQPKHKKLEIGSTWLHPDYWATAVNFECKLLLLTYCFETLETVRVQFKTDENNWRSRKAIEKVGGRFEGILRHDMLRDNLTKRNSAYFSITDDEWADKKIKLIELLRLKMSAGA